MPKGRLSFLGQSSVRNSAMPKLTGTPINKAMHEVTSVPKIGTKAPNLFETGSHSVEVRKPRPKALMLGMAPMTNEIRMHISIARTKKAKMRVTILNDLSTSNWRCMCCALPNLSIPRLNRGFRQKAGEGLPGQRLALLLIESLLYFQIG